MFRLKILLLVLDGIGDRPAPELGYKTPLEAARTPHLDRLADIGVNGQFFPMMPGIAPATDLAHFVMFGYDLAQYPGRAVMEAMGEGLSLSEGQAILRARFVSVEEKTGSFAIQSRIIPDAHDDARKLAKTISTFESNGIRFELQHLRGEQANILLYGDASAELTDSDPLIEDYPVAKVLAREEAKDYRLAQKTADAVNDYLLWIYEKLSVSNINKDRQNLGQIPINFVLTKWAGRNERLESFEEKWGLRAALSGKHPAIKGLCKHIDIDFISHVDRDDPELVISEQFEHADDLFKEGFKFVVMHNKAADDAAHQKSPALKRDVIERLDSGFDSLYSMPSFTENLLFIVTADHSTPSSGSLIHSAEPVPITIAGPNTLRDDVEVFSERACYKGYLGQMTGAELMPLALTLTDRVKYSGSRITAAERIYIPKNVEALALPKVGALHPKNQK